MNADAILARWPGRCEACGLRIERGDLIIRDDGGWVHDRCRQERDEAAAAVQREAGRRG